MQDSQKRVKELEERLFVLSMAFLVLNAKLAKVHRRAQEAEGRFAKLEHWLKSVRGADKRTLVQVLAALEQAEDKERLLSLHYESLKKHYIELYNRTGWRRWFGGLGDYDLYSETVRWWRAAKRALHRKRHS